MDRCFDPRRAWDAVELDRPRVSGAADNDRRRMRLRLRLRGWLSPCPRVWLFCTTLPSRDLGVTTVTGSACRRGRLLDRCDAVECGLTCRRTAWSPRLLGRRAPRDGDTYDSAVPRWHVLGTPCPARRGVAALMAATMPPPGTRRDGDRPDAGDVEGNGSDPLALENMDPGELRLLADPVDRAGLPVDIAAADSGDCLAFDDAVGRMWPWRRSLDLGERVSTCNGCRAGAAVSAFADGAEPPDTVDEKDMMRSSVSRRDAAVSPASAPLPLAACNSATRASDASRALRSATTNFRRCFTER